MRILFLFFSLLITSCERYVTNIKDVTLSGKYVVSKCETINVSQNTRDSLYLLGSIYTNENLPDPFDTIKINNFYIHFDYSTIRMKLSNNILDRDIWEYGVSPNFIFYRIFGTTPYFNGYLQFDYKTKSGALQRITFIIEDDGIEYLQLKSSGAWFIGKGGQKQTITLSLTRLGP